MKVCSAARVKGKEAHFFPWPSERNKPVFSALKNSEKVFNFSLLPKLFTFLQSLSQAAALWSFNVHSQLLDNPCSPTESWLPAPRYSTFFVSEDVPVTGATQKEKRWKTWSSEKENMMYKSNVPQRSSVSTFNYLFSPSISHLRNSTRRWRVSHAGESSRFPPVVFSPSFEGFYTSMYTRRRYVSSVSSGFNSNSNGSSNGNHSNIGSGTSHRHTLGNPSSHAHSSGSSGSYAVRGSGKGNSSSVANGGTLSNTSSSISGMPTHAKSSASLLHAAPGASGGMQRATTVNTGTGRVAGMGSGGSNTTLSSSTMASSSYHNNTANSSSISSGGGTGNKGNVPSSSSAHLAASEAKGLREGATKISSKKKAKASKRRLLRKKSSIRGLLRTRRRPATASTKKKEMKNILRKKGTLSSGTREGGKGVRAMTERPREMTASGARAPRSVSSLSSISTVSKSTVLPAKFTAGKSSSTSLPSLSSRSPVKKITGKSSRGDIGGGMGVSASLPVNSSSTSASPHSSLILSASSSGVSSTPSSSTSGKRRKLRIRRRQGMGVINSPASKNKIHHRRRRHHRHPNSPTSSNNPCTITSRKKKNSSTSSVLKKKRKKISICVLSSSYKGTGSETADYDNYVCTPAHYIEKRNRNKYRFTNVEVEKNDVYRMIRELISSQKYDLFFNLCDGGRDEKRAGVEVVHALEDFNAAFTGSDSRRFEPSKVDMKLLVNASGVRVPNYALLKKVEGLAKRCCHLRFPVIVKHLTGYASVGIQKDNLCHNIDQLRTKVTSFVSRFNHALVEEFIVGREGTVLATADPNSSSGVKVFRPLMFNFLSGPDDFAYFDKKWKVEVNESSHSLLPLSDPAYPGIINMARNAFHFILNGVGYGRVDFRIDEQSNEPVFLEINPNCGMWYNEKDGGDYADLMVLADPQWTHEKFFYSSMKQAMKQQAVHKPWYLVSQDKNGMFTTRATRTVPAQHCLFGNLSDPVPVLVKSLFKLKGSLPMIAATSAACSTGHEKVKDGEALGIVQSSDPKGLVSSSTCASSSLSTSAPSSEEEEDALSNTVSCVVIRADGRRHAMVTIRHSCEPNMQFIHGQTLVCATKRPISVGEELSIDYGTLRDGNMPCFSCTCGTKNCRSIIFPTPATPRTIEEKAMRKILREKKKQWLKEKEEREAEKILKKRSRNSSSPSTVNQHPHHSGTSLSASHTSTSSGGEGSGVGPST